MTTARTNAPGVLLRPAAAALDMSRKKLLRLIGEGLPVTRKGERVYVDLAEAEAWIALNEGAGEFSPKIAAVLHPDDPRWRERTAAAKIEEINLALARGEFVLTEDVQRISVDEAVTLRGALSRLSQRMGIVNFDSAAADVKAAIESVLEPILAPFAHDAPAWFPTPRPAPEEEFDFEGGERETLPKLSSGDPRYDFAVTQMQKRESELRVVIESVFPFEDACKFRQEFNALVCKHVGKIPAGVAKALDAMRNERSVINEAINKVARAALLSITADASHRQKHFST